MACRERSGAARQKSPGWSPSGVPNKEVSLELGLSPKTVEWHLSRLYRRLGVRSRTELSVLLLAPEARDGDAEGGMR